MQKVLLFFVILAFLALGNANAQVTGFLEDFNDNVLSGWEMPHPATFNLVEADSVLQITYDRTATTWEWDNFNFAPPLIDVSKSPFISVRVKSSVSTELTFKPIYASGSQDWLQSQIPGDNTWHTVYFQLVGHGGSMMNRIYVYFDGGSTTPTSGMVYFDNLAIGDSVKASSTPAYAALEQALDAAKALSLNSAEGTAEGQFRIGSKAVLEAAIQQAQFLFDSDTLSVATIEKAVWELYDACTRFETGVSAVDIGLIDPLATVKTRYLYANLAQYATDNLMFGMHDATGYGVGWTGDDDRSDVKDVCGDYPAIYSWDLSAVDKNSEMDRYRYRITSAFARGGIHTICWHQSDPQGRGFYAKDVNNERIVATILPGGTYHNFYKDRLYNVALFLKGLRGVDGHAIPIIFRPYHEHDGNWFWWGVGHCTNQEYNSLWRFTVSYLRDSLNVHNLLYAISPSGFNSLDDYLDPFPGKQWIDVYGMDFYFEYPVTPNNRSDLLKRLHVIVQLAEQDHKVAALTEVGQEGVKTYNWYTLELLKPLKYDSIASNVAYAAVWRNANTSHHYAPYPGHSSVPDFLQFYQDPYTLFERDLPAMYSQPVQDNSAPFFTTLPAQNFIASTTQLTLQLETNERAFLRYSTADQPYQSMANEFTEGQGDKVHRLQLQVRQGNAYTFYVRAADYYGNVMDTSAVITFSVDTLQAPVYWHDLRYQSQDWKTGPAPLGYGNSSDATVVQPAHTLYFRSTFVLTDSLTALGLLLKCHDGAVAYLNGREIGRVNMPDGAVDYDTPALNTNVSSKVLVLSPDALKSLRIGENVIAVEVHQAFTTSPNLSFDARLFNATTFFINLGATWFYYDAGDRPRTQTVGEILSGLNADEPDLPATFALAQNYPNPFNPVTKIRYALPRSAPVRLQVYDLNGRRVATLVDQRQGPGNYEVSYNARNLASGFYFYRLQAGATVLIKRMILLK